MLTKGKTTKSFNTLLSLQTELFLNNKNDTFKQLPWLNHPYICPLSISTIIDPSYFKSVRKEKHKTNALQELHFRKHTYGFKKWWLRKISLLGIDSQESIVLWVLIGCRSNLDLMSKDTMTVCHVIRGKLHTFQAHLNMIRTVWWMNLKTYIIIIWCTLMFIGKS